MKEFRRRTGRISPQRRLLQAFRYALGLSLALLVVCQSWAFWPIGEDGHKGITRSALSQVSRQVSGQTLRFSQRAIGEVILWNVDADCGGDAWCDCNACQKDSPRHFDNESFLGSTTRLKNLKQSIISKIADPSPRGASARRDLGQALHTVQDYYSHSNWVNMGFTSVIDTRLGRDAFDHTNDASPLLADPEMHTCPDDQTQLGGDGLHFITTGFYNLDDTCNAPRDPARKCRHGDLLAACPEGLNKDYADRPLFPDAKRVAIDASIDFVNQILDDPAVANNPRAIRALMDVGSTLAVVVDTGTLGVPELNDVKALVNNEVNDVRGTQHEPAQYILVSFNGMTVQRALVTANADDFLAALNAVDINSLAVLPTRGNAILPRRRTVSC